MLRLDKSGSNPSTRSNKKGERVFCEGKLGTITEGWFTQYKSYCEIQYDNGSTNTSNTNDEYLRFANRPDTNLHDPPTIPCYAIGLLPPEGARQMVYEDSANKKDQRVFCEGKDGMITDVNHDSNGSYCKIQYDDGTKNTYNTNDEYLRFALGPGWSGYTIPCFTNNRPPPTRSPNTLKSDSGKFERCECLNWDGTEPWTQGPLNKFKCEELILLPSGNCMTKYVENDENENIDVIKRYGRRDPITGLNFG